MLRKQSRDTNRNIKRLLQACTFGSIGTIYMFAKNYGKSETSSFSDEGRDRTQWMYVVQRNHFEVIMCVCFPTEVMSTQESVKRFSYRQIPGLTSLPSTLTAKTSMKMKISSDKIYYNFSQENPRITNI